jgi:abortive infection bacteriophage resistance protein
MNYSKPWQSYQQQLNLLKSRGLVVSDEAKALEHLERIGYYRLSGYWYSFRERSEVCCPLEAIVGRKYKKGQTDKLVLDAFKQGAAFSHAVDLYVFDKKLRLLVLDALERIEIAIRVDVAYTLGQKDPFAYLKPTFFFDGFAQELKSETGLTEHHKWLGKHAELINRSREKFIEHNKVKYGLPLPIWIVCEIWDFGTLSTLYAGMKEEDQDRISHQYGISNGRVFASWLRSLNYLRNVCAHHSRLWNRNIIDQPKLPKRTEAPIIDRFADDAHRLARPFLLLCIMQHLLITINPSSTWGNRVKQLLSEFPILDGYLDVSLQGMGVLQDWQSLDW